MNTLEALLKGAGQPVTLNRFGRRTKLIEIFKQLGFTRGVEIGTDHGGYAKNLLDGIPDLHLVCIDPWVAYAEGDDVKSQQDVDKIYEEAKNLLAPYDCKILRKTSEDASWDFPSNYFDFAFIDGNHEYEHVLQDIKLWTNAVKPGGIVCGHDYKSDPSKKYGVIEAVRQYTKENNVSPLFVLHTGGTFVDCWAFVKEGK